MRVDVKVAGETVCTGSYMCSAAGSEPAIHRIVLFVPTGPSLIDGINTMRYVALALDYKRTYYNSVLSEAAAKSYRFNTQCPKEALHHQVSEWPRTSFHLSLYWVMVRAQWPEGFR